MRKKRLRLIDVINFVWSTVHDFVYVGIVALFYWISKQPAGTRRTYEILLGFIALIVLDTVINSRQHHKFDDRLDDLEETVHQLEGPSKNAHRAATSHHNREEGDS